MNNNALKTMLACALGAAFPATLFAQATPTAEAHSHYTGNSFVAHWQSTDDAEGYLLSVFTKGEKHNVCETFDKVNQTDGKIDAQNPNYPDGWDVSVSLQGQADMTTDSHKLLLDATGDYIATRHIIGCNVANYAVGASLVNADGITRQNSSVFVVDFYGQDGQRITGGEIEALYFAQRPVLSLTEALGYDPANVASIKISLRKDDTRSVGDIAIDSICYDYDAPAYVMHDKATADTTLLVDGLSADEVYWYYVKGENASGTSAESNIVRVDEFLVPVALEATNISATAYTARWQRLPKATTYIVNNYKIDDVAAGTAYNVLHETFDKATEGTTDQPVAVSDADIITDNAGWTGRNIIMAEGMMGADAGRYPMNLSYLHSPELYLAGENGKYAITLKAHGTPGDYLSVYRVGYMVDNDGDGTAESLNIHKTGAFDESGNLQETWEMNDGVDAMVLSIEESKLKQFLIDEITITQTAQTNTTVKTLLQKATISDGSTTEHTFDGLTAGEQYAYDVTGLRLDQYGYEELSDVSELIVVRLTTSIGNGITADTKMQMKGNTIVLTLGQSARVALYTLDGKTVKSLNAAAGTCSMTMPSCGAYILKVGATSYKVTAR